MITLKPAYVAALVARSHGQVILTREEIYDAERRLLVDLQENDRGEIVITTYKPEHLPDAGSAERCTSS